jgi:transcriptional regulator
MRQNPSFALAAPQEIKRLIRENPWAILVSDTPDGLVASHYPVLVDETRDELAVVTHVGRPDDEIHGLGQRELLIIIQGPHGYISPSWYDADPAVPTWNFISAHLTGVPEVLSPEENLRVLGSLVDHFEDRVENPRRMLASPIDAEYARRISSGTVGIRLTPTKIVAKQKMSQNRKPEIVQSIMTQLEGDGPYASAALAAEMRRVHGRP